MFDLEALKQMEALNQMGYLMDVGVIKSKLNRQIDSPRGINMPKYCRPAGNS